MDDDVLAELRVGPIQPSLSAHRRGVRVSFDGRAHLRLQMNAEGDGETALCVAASLTEVANLFGRLAGATVNPHLD